MDAILAVLTQNILPIFVVAGFGYALRRWLALDQRALSSAVFNVLSPSLVFASLVNSQLPGGELIELGVFTILTITIMGLLAALVARLLKLGRRETAAFLVLVMFVNSGNFGLTLIDLRYGTAGLSRAVVYYTTSTVLIYTVGVLLASLGRLHWREAVKRLVRLPAVYAAVAAVVVYSFRIPVPGPLMSAVEVAGAGAIPVMLLVLGMQLADLKGGVPSKLAIPAITLRLLVAPVVAVLVTVLLGLEGLARSTSIIEASMPPAVFTIVLATEFGLHASWVTSIVLLATLISPFTVAAVISVLGL